MGIQFAPTIKPGLAILLLRGKAQVVHHTHLLRLHQRRLPVARAMQPKRIDGARALSVDRMGVEQHLHFVLQASQGAGSGRQLRATSISSIIAA